LPNDGALPTASIFTESSEEIFPPEWYFVTKLGPQVSLFPVPIFGVNSYAPRCAKTSSERMASKEVQAKQIGRKKEKRYKGLWIFPLFRPF
jgi:hypothetical protein